LLRDNVLLPTVAANFYQYRKQTDGRRDGPTNRQTDRQFIERVVAYSIIAAYNKLTLHMQAPCHVKADSSAVSGDGGSVVRGWTWALAFP